MLTLTAGLLFLWMAQAAPPAGELLAAPASLKSRPLADGQIDRYRLTLRSQDALVGVVMQHGIDVIVTLRDPQGRVALEVDSPNGSDGPESLAYVAAVDGSYAIEIRPFERGSRPGRYDLDVEPVRAATARERGLAEAQQLYATAMSARTEALALLSRGRWQETMRRYADARAGAERVLALRTSAFGERHYDVAVVHALLGLIDDEVGNYASGQGHFARAVEILEQLLGPDHPNTLTMRSDLGYLMLAAGRWQEAAGLFTRTSERREQLQGPDHSSVASGLAGLGETLYRLADLDRAEAVLRRNLAIREKSGASAGVLTNGRLQLAVVLLARHELDQAEAICDGVRATLEARPETDQLHLATAHGCLAGVRSARHDAARAVEHARRSAALREACDGPDHPATAQALAGLGRALRIARDTSQAEQVLTRAEKTQLARLGPDHPLLADTLSELGATIAERDPARARALYDRAVAIRSAALPPTHPAIAEAKAARARIDGR